MAWPKPLYSKTQVNRAGEILLKWYSAPIIDDKLDWEEIRQAFKIVDNWRSCHGYPINTFQATLRNKLKSVDKNALVAQRLKRMPSIMLKLRRFKSMKLARMQDLGGLRAVVSSLKKMRQLEINYQNSRFSHKLVSKKDYISNPKNSYVFRGYSVCV